MPAAAGVERGMGVGVEAEVIVAGCKDSGIYSLGWKEGNAGGGEGGSEQAETNTLVVEKCDHCWRRFCGLRCLAVMCRCAPAYGWTGGGREEGRGGKEGGGWGNVR